MPVRTMPRARALVLLACVLAALLLCVATTTPVRAEEAQDELEVAEGRPDVLLVTVSFVGPQDEEWDRVEGVALARGSTAWTATTAVLSRSRLYYTTGLPTSRDALVALSQNLDDMPYRFDQETGSGWRLYRNGKRYKGSASSLELDDGDEISWRYEVGMIVASVAVVGPGGTGESYWIAPTNVRVPYGQSAWETSLKVLEKSGYRRGRLLTYSWGEDGSVRLESISSLGENGITGESWRSYVNGEIVDDVAHVGLKSGDSVCWYYVGNGVRSLPDFVLRDLASSRGVSSVRVEGVVEQAWVRPVSSGDGQLTALRQEPGLRLSGDSSLCEILSSGLDLEGNLTHISENGTWGQSLARVLEDTVNMGMGGRAVRAVDGSVLFLDDAGDVVKLVVR